MSQVFVSRLLSRIVLGIVFTGPTRHRENFHLPAPVVIDHKRNPFHDPPSHPIISRIFSHHGSHSRIVPRIVLITRQDLFLQFCTRRLNPEIINVRQVRIKLNVHQSGKQIGLQLIPSHFTTASRRTGKCFPKRTDSPCHISRTDLHNLENLFWFICYFKNIARFSFAHQRTQFWHHTQAFTSLLFKIDDTISAAISGTDSRGKSGNSPVHWISEAASKSVSEASKRFRQCSVQSSP